MTSPSTRSPRPASRSASIATACHPLYGDLAETYRVPLLDGAWSEILGRRELRSDQIHANDEGYRLFAEKAADFLRRQGFFRP